MKANEIRVGNWVNDKFYGDFEVIGLINFNDGNQSAFKSLDDYPQSQTIDLLNPIPLTEDWLIKFGFEVYNSESTFRLLSYKSTNVLDKEITKEFEVYVNLEDGISISLDSVEVDESGNLECINIKLNHIKHVHQLQNLIYALTNEELKITQ